MAWFNLFNKKSKWERSIEMAKKLLDLEAKDSKIREPVGSIVNSIIKHRHRFILSEITENYRTIYTAYDKKEGETLTIIYHKGIFGYDHRGGMTWISPEESEWAYNEILNSIYIKKKRAQKICDSKERSRLTRLYKGKI